MANVSPFLSRLDIGNRAVQRLGGKLLTSFDTTVDTGRNAQQISFCYDKLRVAELRRSTWRFASRRANLRATLATSRRFIPSVYAAGTTYAAGAIVMDATGVYWISNVASNTGNTPGGVPTAGYPAYWSQYFGPVIGNLWVNSIVYDAGEIVFKSGSPNVWYINGTNAVAAATDPASGAPWVPITTVTTDQLVTNFQPMGVGKTVNSRARNLFPLPLGFLRMLASDPKVEGTLKNDTSGNIQSLDYQFEGNFIISAASDPILLRFVADVSNVLEMDSLFCEGLAARIAYETCEIITQSDAKKQAAAISYQAFINEARLINAIEIGNTEAQETGFDLRGPQENTRQAGA